MKNEEALNLFKIYLSQSYMRKPNQVNYHDNGHDNSGGHADYHNDSHDNTPGRYRLKLVKNERNKHFN